MKKEKLALEEIFSPRGVAVAGASPSGGFITRVVQSLKEAGFPTIYPVNPKHTEVLGLPCYPGLTSIPGVVDHVVVGIPAESALALLDDCTAKGVKSVHFFTAGFSESVIIQLAAVRSAIESVAGLILKNYMKICFEGETVTECVDVESLARAIAIWGKVHVGD